MPLPIAKLYNFWQYEFVGYGREWDHLKKPKESENDLLITETVERKQGVSLREIGRKLGIQHQKADRLLKKEVIRSLGHCISDCNEKEVFIGH